MARLPLALGEIASRPLVHRAAFALAAFALAGTGYWLLFSGFAPYDDEGYIMMAAREYFAHGRLYDLVYSQYGPAFHAAVDAAQHLLGRPVDHALARWLTLGCWLAAAAACAALVWRGTASRALTGFTLVATFLYLYFLRDEPFHPGSLIVALLAVSTWQLACLVDRENWTAAAAVAGGTAAFLLLTKINVGVFHLAAISAWAFLHAASSGLRRLAPAALVLGLPLLAAAVMHTLVAEPWVQVYLAVFSVGVVGLVLAVRPDGVFTSRHLGIGAIAAAAVAAVVLAAIALRGTSLAGLLHGALLGPLRHPGNYSYPVDWRPGTLAVAALSLGLALALPWLRSRHPARTERLLVALRLALIAALAAGVLLLMHARVIGAVFSYVAPLLWLWVVPLGGDSPRNTGDRSRALLALVLLLQYLHAYPVGGSQESWGTFLLFPLVALGLGDLRRRWRDSPAATPRSARTWQILAASLAVLAAGKLAWAAVETRSRYAARTDLGLPGTAGLRLAEKDRTAYRLLALNASVHADTLFSLPGMFSFNLWTGLPAPTARNTTLWFTLLTDAEQHSIIARLRSDPRACIVVHEGLVQLLRANAVPLRGPLYDCIHLDFALAFRVAEHAFLVRTGRSVAPLGLGRLAPAAAPGPGTRLEFTLVGDGTPVSRAVVAGSRIQLDARNSRVAATPTNRDGNVPRGPPATAWPFPCHGVTRVMLETDTDLAALAPGTVLQLHAADGRLLHEVRLAPPP